MATRVGINGFGRIGRQVMKIIMDKYPNDLEVVAFNDLGDLPTMAHLYKYDSYGITDDEVVVGEGTLTINGKPVKASPSASRASCPGVTWAWTSWSRAPAFFAAARKCSRTSTPEPRRSSSRLRPRAKST